MDPTDSPAVSELLGTHSPGDPMDFHIMMNTCFKMLSRGLAQMASQITSTIQADLQNLGTRIEAIEKKLNRQSPELIRTRLAYKIYRINWTRPSSILMTWKIVPGVTTFGLEGSQKQL